MNYKEYVENRNKLMQELKDCMKRGDTEGFKGKKEEIEALDQKWEEYAKAKADMEALENKAPKMNPLIDLENGELVEQTRKNVDVYDTTEYKNAFMEYVCRGTQIPEKFKNANTKTTTGDAGAVIPTTLTKEIIREMKSYGNIYEKVRKLNVKGGVEFPILTLKPTASWVGENSGEDQKISANEKVSFSYHGLECKIAQTLLASVVTIEEFQNLFVELAVEAIVKAMEIGITSGDGNGKMLGITKDTRVPEKNVIELNSDDMGNWQKWKKNVFKKMKKSYKNGTFIMAQSTFEGYIDAMVDTTGQPIGRINYGIDGGETYRFGGKAVETVEDDIIPDFDTAEVGDVVAVFVKLSDYAINSNMEMRSVKWEDHDTNEVKNKVIVVVDGKLLDPNGVLIIKKKADAKKTEPTTPETQTNEGQKNEGQ